jgi:hypothetical protein
MLHSLKASKLRLSTVQSRAHLELSCKRRARINGPFLGENKKRRFPIPALVTYIVIILMCILELGNNLLLLAGDWRLLDLDLDLRSFLGRAGGTKQRLTAARQTHPISSNLLLHLVSPPRFCAGAVWESNYAGQVTICSLPRRNVVSGTGPHL